jgi:ribokinase
MPAIAFHRSEIMSPQDKLKTNERSKPRVVVVGGYNADLLIRCETPLVAGKSLVGGPMQIYGGGRGANCAVAAARAGCAVAFVGAYGRDWFGGMALSQLAGESIDLDYFFELPHVKTGTSLSLIEAGAGKHFLICAESANDRVTPKMVHSARGLVLSADLVISELEIPSRTVWAVMKLCEQHSIPFVLDISPLNRINCLPDNNILLVVSESIEEAMAITSTKTVPDAIQELHRLGCQNVVLINNSREVTYSDRQKIETKVVPVESVIDRCGATECLETWIGLSLIRQKSLAEACEEAILAMAYSLSRMGGHHSMPRRSDIRMGRGHTRGFASI